MRLLGSMVVSMILVGVLWGIAWLQPAYADSRDKIEKTNEVKSQKPAFKALAISGVTRKTQLALMPKLWQAFNNKHQLNAQLKRQPEKIYVYYRDFSANYDSAQVTIGYDKADLNKPSNNTLLPELDYQTLLEKRKYSDDELTGAWHQVDYRKGPAAIVEIHYLSNNNEVRKSEMLVAYK